MGIREKLDRALLDFSDVNLDSEVGRSALIDRIMNIVDDTFEKRAMRILNKEKEEQQIQLATRSRETSSQEIVHPD